MGKQKAIKRKITNEQYLQEVPWNYDAGGTLLGGAQGAMSGAAAGAAIVPPWGAIVGGAVGGVLGMAKSVAGDNAQKRQDEADRVSRTQQNRLQQYNNMIGGSRDTQIPTFAFGGALSEYYTPASRPMQNMYALGGDINKINERFKLGWQGWMANGGYFQDPSWYQSNALSLAAGGHLPEGNATLKEAKEFEKLYPEEFEFGTETEYEHTGNKKLAMRIAADHIKDSVKMNQGAPPDYYKKLQMAGISDELNKLPLMTMAKGGFLSASKASEMLKDGKIHGKPLSDRQKAYFQAIAHGWKPGEKAMGGSIYANGGPGFVMSQNPNVPSQEALMKDPNYLGTTAWKPAGARANAAATDAATYKAFKNKSIEDFHMYDNKAGNKPLQPYVQPKMGAAVNLPTQDYQGLINSFNTVAPGSMQGPIQYNEKLRDNAQFQTDLQRATDQNVRMYQMMQDRAFGGSVPGFAGTGRILDVGNTSGNNQNNNTNFEKNIVTKYDTGGTHEENRYGGIQVGPKARVEEGEYRFDDPDSGESYIFSNRF